MSNNRLANFFYFSIWHWFGTGLGYQGLTRTAVTLLHFTWSLSTQLVGWLIGFFNIVILGAQPYRFVNTISTEIGPKFMPKAKWGGALSMGSHTTMNFKFQTTDFYYDQTLAHEQGHYYQTLILGPLWWFVIAIPSFVRATWRTIFKIRGRYYNFYTESWADKLGGVER